MFDIAFSEIALIAVVALVVIGPERLPKVARTLGHMFGRLQRYVSDVKADINREIELDELRKLKSEVRAVEHELNATVADAATPVPDPGTRADASAVAAQAASAQSGAQSGEPSTEPAAKPSPRADADAPPRQSSLPGLDLL